MAEFESCGRAPVGIVTNCAAMGCEGKGCAMDALQVPVSLDDLRIADDGKAMELDEFMAYLDKLDNE